jgi:hypothetical protein
MSATQTLTESMDQSNASLDELNIEGLEWRLEVVSLDDCYIGRYQRPADEGWLKKRDGSFKPWLLGTITVSERHDKKTKKRFAVIDGQHRCELARRNGIGKVAAVVFYNLTEADEARLFSAFQQERRNITPFQRFNSDIIAGDSQAKAVNKMVNEEGLEFGERTDPHVIKAVVAVERIYEDDPDMLRLVLRLMQTCWGGMPYVTSDRIMRGLHGFLKEVGEDFDQARFIDRLSNVTPSTLIDRAKNLKDGRGAGGAAAKYVQEAINDAYRSRSRASR